MPHERQDTPMMQQYKEIKSEYEDAYLFYRLGDFYELFYQDAEEVSQLLELTLTSRNKKADDPVPMCGIPYHSADQYVKRLIELGYKVAICEQVEDPKQSKGMVKREVVQVITPGTVMEESSLKESENNYLSALYEEEGQYFFSYVDLSTGELRATVLDSVQAVINECNTISTKEMVIEEDSDLKFVLGQQLDILFSHPRSSQMIAFDFAKENLSSALRRSVRLLLTYLSDTQMRSLDHIQELDVYQADQYLRLGPGARKNLEINRSLRDQSKYGSLYWLLDETKTAMGSRMLKTYLDKPLINREQIEKRMDAVDNLLDHYFERMDLIDLLKKVYDLERLAGRIAFQTVNARDLIQLKQSLEQVPLLEKLIQSINQEGTWNTWLEMVDSCQDIRQWIEEAVEDAPPISITEGGIIKENYDKQLDQYLDALHNGKQWIAQLQAEEREKTGIKNLKVGFNKVFGYYIEVTKANLDLVDEERYERKQTLVNAERFITPELKEKEKIILEAEEGSQQLEYELFVALRERIKKEIDRIQLLAKALSQLDVLQAFATVSERYSFVRPSFHEDSQDIKVKSGRHPVVEKVMGDQTYVPNDVIMNEDTDILLITGPNMSGKSTYMRQLALTVIMAQIGCFVPAEKAELAIFDQIFTRIGAMDDLIGGQSTFMVEMNEANIALQKASSKSLLLFDELGRGTATYDGMALAQSIIEYIHNHIQAKTLFSTHYHELTQLEQDLPRLKNVHVGAIEDQEELIFLHKIEEGPADKSYGVQVAKLAGLPDEVISQADKILSEIEVNKEEDIDDDLRPVLKEDGQMSLFLLETNDVETHVLDQIKNLDLANMTLMDAMNVLNDLQSQMRDH